MIGPGQQPEYSTGEKVVNAIGNVIIKFVAVPIAWIWRKLRRK